MLIRLLVCGGMAIARLVELIASNHNLRRPGGAREGRWSARTYPLIVAVHALVIGGTALKGSPRPCLGWLVVLLAMQPLRAWVLLLLGSRWNARGTVARSTVVETRGPYAVIRHPNYLIVATELFVLPLAFRLPRLAVVTSVLDAGLLAVRVHDEEAALMQLPGYREHFARKRRFVPGVF